MRNAQAIAGGAVVLAVLTACGGGGGGSDAADDFADGSAKEIIKAAADDMRAADTLRMVGDVTTDGDKISLDMQVSAQGDCQGSLSMSGGTAELISIGSETWFKPDAAFWRASAGPQAEQIIGLVGDDWVVVPAEEGDISSLCDLDEFTEELDSEDAGEDDSATTAGTEEIDGQEAVVIESETDEGDPLKAWVAVDGEHYILQMEVTEGEEPGTITFSDFDEELDVEAPPDDQVTDFSSMGG